MQPGHEGRRTDQRTGTGMPALGTALPLVLGAGGTTTSGAAVALAETNTAVFAALALGLVSLAVTAYEMTLRHLDKRDARRWAFVRQQDPGQGKGPGP
jgi:hypothetical protein